MQPKLPMMWEGGPNLFPSIQNAKHRLIQTGKDLLCTIVTVLVVPTAFKQHVAFL